MSSNYSIGVDRTASDPAYSHIDIIENMRESIQKVQKLMDISEAKCQILLQNYKWNVDSLWESLQAIDDKSIFLASNGISESDIIEVKDTECSICCEEGTVLGLSCGHTACRGCWKQYLAQNIDQLRIGCISPSCHLVLCLDSIISFGGNVFVHRNALIKSYLESNPQMIKCPASICPLTVFANKIRTVQCPCRLRFCSQCLQQPHSPATCLQIQNWGKKNRKGVSDQKSFEWIIKNTKECPKCSTMIQKNGGCDHMTCRKCKYSFCWSCSVSWREHYNRKCYKEDVSKTMDRLNSRSNNHFMFLFNKNQNKLDSEKQLDPQVNRHNLHTLLESRRVLMYSFVYEYYGNYGGEFKKKQKKLEESVNAFSDLLKKGVESNKKKNVEYRHLEILQKDFLDYCQEHQPGEASLIKSPCLWTLIIILIIVVFLFGYVAFKLFELYQ